MHEVLGIELVGPGDKLEGPGDEFEGPGGELEGPGEEFEGPGEELEGPGEELEGPGEELEGPGEELEGLADGPEDGGFGVDISSDKSVAEGDNNDLCTFDGSILDFGTTSERVDATLLKPGLYIWNTESFLKWRLYNLRKLLLGNYEVFLSEG